MVLQHVQEVPGILMPALPPGIRLYLLTLQPPKQITPQAAGYHGRVFFFFFLMVRRRLDYIITVDAAVVWLNAVIGGVEMW